MSYNVYITRGSIARKKSARPITLGEIQAVAAAHPRLRVEGHVLLWQPRRFEGFEGECGFALERGNLRYDGPNRIVLDVMRDMALLLRANVVGESHEVLAEYTDAASAENALAAKGDRWAWDLW